MTNYFFSIIVVSWNAKKHLETFLPSVAATKYPSFEIIIADNASTDGSREWVEEHYPNIRVTTFDKNYGYCGGNNRGAEAAKGDILLFLNNDVETPPEWLDAINKAFNEEPQTAIIQPRLLSWRQKDSFEYAGAAGGFIDHLGYPFCRGRIFSTIEKDSGQYDDKRAIFWASGAAFAIRKNVFEELGGFDENFEFHMEEIDLCWRAWKLGYRVLCEPESIVYHLGGGSLPSDDPKKTFYNFRNSLFMLWKNYTRKQRILLLPVRYLLDFVAFLHFLLVGKFKEAMAVGKAYLGFWSKRKDLDIKEISDAKDEQPFSYPFSIVYNYYIKKKTTFSQLERKGNRIEPL